MGVAHLRKASWSKLTREAPWVPTFEAIAPTESVMIPALVVDVVRELVIAKLGLDALVSLAAHVQPTSHVLGLRLSALLPAFVLDLDPADEDLPSGVVRFLLLGLFPIVLLLDAVREPAGQFVHLGGHFAVRGHGLVVALSRLPSWHPQLLPRSTRRDPTEMRKGRTTIGCLFPRG
jgi:hypothetical protein